MMHRVRYLLAVLLLSFVAGLVVSRPASDSDVGPQTDVKALATPEPAETSKPVAPAAPGIRVILASPYEVRTD
jgi:hypothetical protein